MKTPRLAGCYADELNAYPAPADEYRARIERAHAAAASAGRDPAGLLISSSGQMLAADTKDEYRDKLAALAEEVGADAEELEAAAAKRNTPRGTWDDVRSILGGMADAGLTRFYFQGEFDPEDIEMKLSKLT